LEECAVGEVRKTFGQELNKTKSQVGGKNINQNYIYEDTEKPERLNKKETDEFKKYFS